jgi:hypothetical protein
MTAAANTSSSETDAVSEVTHVVDMLDSLAAGDVTTAITGLEDLLTRLRQAETARDLLVDVDRNILKAALLLRCQRTSGGAAR